MSSPAAQFPVDGENLEILRDLRERINAERSRRKRDKPQEKVQEPKETSPLQRAKEGVDLGLVDEATRQKVRSTVESLPSTLQFLIEMAPSTVGTILGARGGLKGASAVGLAGEQLGQETGLTPRSNLGLALGAGGPVAGKVAGKGLQLGRKAIARTAGGFAPARVALTKNLMRKAAAEFESIGTKIVAGQQGLLKASTDTLYGMAEKVGVKIPAFNTTATRGAFAPIRKELTPFKSQPEVRSALRLLDDLEQTMKGSSVSFPELMTIREIAGTAIRKAARSTGSKKVKGAQDQLYKAVSDDIDFLASRGGKTGGAARIAVAAGKRARLDFAVKDMEQAAAQFTTLEEGTNVLKMNVVAMRKWFRNATNPKSKMYKKNMTQALGDQVDEISERLRILSQFTDTSPGGPGSLVVRGMGAAAGGGAGFAVGGAPGAAIGALIGVRGPEMFTAILSSGPAIRFLEASTKLGTRPLTPKLWEIAGQIAAQGAKGPLGDEVNDLLEQSP